MRFTFVLACVALASPCQAATRADAPASPSAPRPNIVVIMADDLGYSDPGCYGGEIETPNIDRLAGGGLRYTSFYNCSRCCQTRASLLTGAYPHRIGMAEFGRTMNTSVPTVVQSLRESGYGTGMVGKWHLSRLPDTSDEQQRIRWMNHEVDLKIPFAKIQSYPTRRGFQKFYGIVWGVVDHFDPFSLTDGETPVDQVPEDFYFTDAITQRSVEQIDQFTEQDAPFFLYVAYTAPHWPLHARRVDIDKYRGRYEGGWPAVRRQRHARQVELGLVPAEAPLGKNSARRGSWRRLSDEQQAYESAKMEVHAAMVDRVDQGVGQIVQTLEDAGELENTLIVFLSDNGASPEIPGHAGYDRNGGTRDGRAALREADLRRGGNIAKLGTDESYTGIGQAWASAANTPLRFWKGESYDGGCRTPMVVHWPAGLATPAGGLTQQVGHVIDLAPTFLEVAGATALAGSLLDGASLVGSLGGEAVDDRTLYFDHQGGHGVRRGRWKASRLPRGEWELFDIVADPGEVNNLAAAHPAKLTQLVESWDSWLAEVSADQ